MKYENSHKKLEQINNQDRINQNDLQDINRETSNLRITIDNLQNINNMNKNYYLYETEWVTPNTYEINQFEVDNFLHNYYYEWRINLPDMPVSYLPFINVEMIYKLNEVGDTSLTLENFHRSNFFQIQEIDTNDIVKGIILVAGLSFTNITTYFPLQVKLIITIQNPTRII